MIVILKSDFGGFFTQTPTDFGAWAKRSRFYFGGAARFNCDTIVHLANRCEAGGFILLSVSQPAFFIDLFRLRPLVKMVFKYLYNNFIIAGLRTSKWLFQD